MERLDRELQKRVWQRVQARGEQENPPVAADNIKPLILTAQENAVAYRRAAQRAGQRDRDRLMGLYREARQCIACMQGICRVRGEQAKVPPLTPGKEPMPRVLQKCYHRERRLWEEWERRTGDPEHGVVFGRLAQQARARCATIMEILGNLEG